MNDISKTIQWADWSWNPVKGLCPVGCWYCYAAKIYKRFKMDKDPWVDIAELNAVLDTKREAKKIFVCSTFEIFHPITKALMVRTPGKSICVRDAIFDVIERRPDLTFIVLTKMPERIDRPMPDNVHLGVSVEGEKEWHRAKELCIYHDAAVKFISFEPILGPPHDDFQYVAGEFNWFILGRLTGHGKKNNPELGTLKNMVEIAQVHSRPLFMKSNLSGIWPGKLIQQWPEVKA